MTSARSAPSGMPTMGMPITRDAADELTIGVAIEIPEPWATHLQQCREGFGDPLAKAIPAHVTLLPPTAVPRARMSVILDHLSAVAARLTSFELRLAGTDTFRPVSPVVFVRVADGAEGCDALQREVRTGPLERELSFPYHPHVTVAHHLEDGPLDRALAGLRDFSASFPVTGFGLFEHGSDGVWRHRRHFPFGDHPTE